MKSASTAASGPAIAAARDIAWVSTSVPKIGTSAEL